LLKSKSSKPFHTVLNIKAPVQPIGVFLRLYFTIKQPNFRHIFKPFKMNNMKFKVPMMMVLQFAIAVATNAQQGGGPPSGGRGGDPIQRAEMQTKMMIDSLSLSTKQGEKVKEVNLKYANKQKEARAANTDGDWEKMRATMDALRTEQNAELKTMLTQEQYDRWQKIAEAQWQRKGGPQGPPPAEGEKGKGKKGKKDLPPPAPPVGTGGNR
jgi:hypothetical protein